MRTKDLVKISLVSNIFEWYEFCVFGYMAGVIGHLFFSDLDPILSLIKSFSLFAIGYLARPMGSIFFGYLGDRSGRKISLNLSLLMMAVPTVILGFLPTNDKYLYVSFLLLVFLRIFQGFAAGGELPTSACYTYEKTKGSLKPLMCSIVNVSSLLGVILGSFVVFIISSLFTHQQLLNGAWRIPFLLSIPMTIYILYVRRNISESIEPSFENIQLYFREIKTSWRRILQAITLVGFLQASFYILFIWMPSYLHYFLHKPLANVHFFNTVALITMVPSALLFGLLINEKRLKRVVAFSIIFTSLLSITIFYHPSWPSLYPLAILEVLAAFCLAGLDAAIFYILGGLFADRVRCFAITFSFTLSAAVFGGMSPLICTYLINKTGFTFIPSLYISMLGIVSMIILVFLKRESYFSSINYRTSEVT